MNVWSVNRCSAKPGGQSHPSKTLNDAHSWETSPKTRTVATVKSQMLTLDYRAAVWSSLAGTLNTDWTSKRSDRMHLCLAQPVSKKRK